MSVDPKVMQHIGDGSVYHWTKDVALEKFKAGLSRQDGQALGNLAVYKKDGDRYIGWCGVCYSKFLDHMELGYRYCRDAWGKGYATEAARAVLGETYRVTDINEILACTHPDNTPSIRVLEKLGFRYFYAKHSKAINQDIPVFRIDRKTFISHG